MGKLTVPTRWKQDFPVPSAEDSYVTRREFTKFLGLTSLAFLIGTCAAAGRKFLKRILSRPEPPVTVAGIHELPVGGYKLFRFPTKDDPCILLRLSEEQFVAFDQRCTHLSCPVVFDANRKQLVCPCHEGFFSAEDGRPLAGPPKRALEQLPVTTKNAQVLVSQRELVAGWLQSGDESPLLDRRGGCAIKKSCASNQNRADGVVVPRNSWSNHPVASRHPSWPGGAIS
jgi:nitrite reductase/ring-hydroxylating ferredoxin subunit